jgi:hypothetical protein
MLESQARTIEAIDACSEGRRNKMQNISRPSSFGLGYAIQVNVQTLDPSQLSEIES